MSGRSELGVYETFENIYGRKSTLDELVAEISVFTQQSILWVCAVIVTGMQLWNRVDLQSYEVYLRLLSLYFDASLRSRLIAGHWSSNPRRVVFHRRQILLIAKLAILHCSGRGMDARFNAERFGSILLKANDQFHYGLLSEANPRIASREDYAKLIAETIAVGEHGSSNIAHLITRSHLMLTRFTEELRSDPDFIDVAGEHHAATGLTLEEFEAMVFGVQARFGENLVQKLVHEPGVLPLKEANFASTAVPHGKVQRFLDSVSGSPTEMARELQQRDSGPNDFTIFRKFPLVQQWYNLHLRTAYRGLLMLDNLFFLEKIQAGPYWNANAVHGLRLRKFWGAVFERYVNELMCQACAGTQAIFLPDPRPENQPNDQLCDGIVLAGASVVLIEYKSSMFRADTKYGGRYEALVEEIEKKFVQDKEAGQRKGVWQLAHAAHVLFGNGTRQLLPQIEPTKIRRVYLYLVTLDSVGGTIGISPFLETFLNERLDRGAFGSLEIRPLFCSDIETLEDITGHFEARCLPQILEHWFASNPSLTAPLSTMDLGNNDWRENAWLSREWKAIYRTMVSILFPGKDPDAVPE